MNLFVSCILMAIAGFFVPATEGVLVVAASAGTVLAVAGVAALAKGKGLALGAAAGARARGRGKRQVSALKISNLSLTLV